MKTRVDRANISQRTTVPSQKDIAMPQVPRLTDAEIAEIRRRRPGVRVSLACEGLRLTAEEEALFDQFDRERLTPDQRRDRLLAHNRLQRLAKPRAAE
jgi:hypothetical protein